MEIDENVQITAADINAQSELIDIGRTAVDGYLRERLYERNRQIIYTKVFIIFQN